jgi:hypothetical protein
MNTQCPRPEKPCRNKENNVVLYTDDNNIDKLVHHHVRCGKCGYEWNHWEASRDTIVRLLGILYY